MVASLIYFFGFRNLHFQTQFLLFMELNIFLAHGMESLYAFKNDWKETEKNRILNISI